MRCFGFWQNFSFEKLPISLSVSLLFHYVLLYVLLSVIITSWLVVSFRRAILYVFVVVCCRQIIKMPTSHMIIITSWSWCYFVSLLISLLLLTFFCLTT